MSKLIRAILMFLSLSILSACGGGGGSPGVVNGRALFIDIGSTLQILPGESKTVTISGGAQPYTATSNSGAVITSVSGNILTITGSAGGGTGSVLIKDFQGTTVTIAVTVGTGIPLATTAPSAVTLGVNKSSGFFNIVGGTGTYIVSSGSPSIATINQLNNNTFQITGVALGTASIVAADTAGTQILITVTVSASAINAPSISSIVAPLASQNVNISGATTLAISPSLTVVNTGDTLSFQVSNGTAPYTVKSSNTLIVNVLNNSVASTGSTFIASFISPGQASIIVTDATGVTQIVPVVVNSSLSSIYLSPVYLAIDVTNKQTIDFVVKGGSAPFFVTTTNPDLASISLTDATIHFALGNQGNSCVTSDTPVVITVLDSLGLSTTSKVLIRNSSSKGCP